MAKIFKEKVNINIAIIIPVLISLAINTPIIYVGFNLRLTHILIPYLLILLYLNKFKLFMKSYNIMKRTKLYVFFMLFLFLCFYATLYSAPDTLGGLKLFLSILLNATLGVLFYGALISNRIDLNFLIKVSYLSTIAICIIIIIQLLFSIFGLYKPHMYGIDGFFLLGRPSAFFNDPGWLSYWLIISSIIVFDSKRLKKVKIKDFFVYLIFLGLGLLISQSRIGMLFIFVNFYIFILHKKIEERFFLIFFGTVSLATTILLVTYDILYLPENLYYDIVNLKANPRVYDSITIYKEYLKSQNIWFGNGLGSLDRLIELYPWRNYTNAHNILLLQTLNDLGLFGLILIFILIKMLYNKLNNRVTKIIFIQFMILLNFHNIFPYFQLFWFFLPLIFAYDKKYVCE